MKPSIKELKGVHGNKTIAILGGGPSLPSDIKKLPKDCILIGVNHHSTMLGIKAEYCVFMDNPGRESTPAIKLLRSVIESFNDTIRISHHQQFTDYILGIDIDFWDGGFSSATALWLGSYLSSGELLLCGMDCYQGKEKYCVDYDFDFNHPIYSAPIAGHLNAWSPALTRIEKPERIKAVSGPLVELFGEYKK